MESGHFLLLNFAILRRLTKLATPRHVRPTSSRPDIDPTERIARRYIMSQAERIQLIDNLNLLSVVGRWNDDLKAKRARLQDKTPHAKAQATRAKAAPSRTAAYGHEPRTRADVASSPQDCGLEFNSMGSTINHDSASYRDDIVVRQAICRATNRGLFLAAKAMRSRPFATQAATAVGHRMQKLVSAAPATHATL